MPPATGAPFSTSPGDIGMLLATRWEGRSRGGGQSFALCVAAALRRGSYIEPTCTTTPVSTEGPESSRRELAQLNNRPSHHSARRCSTVSSYRRSKIQPADRNPTGPAAGLAGLRPIPPGMSPQARDRASSHCPVSPHTQHELHVLSTHSTSPHVPGMDIARVGLVAPERRVGRVAC